MSTLNKINIAHFIGSLGGGGAEQQVVQLANNLNEDLFNKHIIVIWDKKDGFKNRLNHNVQYYPLQYRRRFFPIGIYKFIKFLKSNRIDVLHSHMYDPNRMAAIIGKAANIPLIVTSEHGRNPWKKWLHHTIEKHLISRSVDFRVAVSNDIRQLRIKYDGVCPSKIITIPNGVTVPNYSKNTSFIPKIIGSMGRLVEAKDFPSLIKSIKIVYEMGYNIKLKIAGRGPLEKTLIKLITSLDMANNIELVGFQKPEEFLKTIDIFAMASVSEGMPVALLEAMSYGLPVVATKTGGILEIIKENSDGLLSVSAQPLAMAQNLVNIIKNEELRSKLGTNARNKIIQIYDIEKVTDRFEELYLKLLNTKSKN